MAGKAAKFVAADIIQHACPIGAGFSGLTDWLTNDVGRYEMLFHLMGQGDFVVTYGKRFATG